MLYVYNIGEHTHERHVDAKNNDFTIYDLLLLFLIQSQTHIIAYSYGCA